MCYTTHISLALYIYTQAFNLSWSFTFCPIWLLPCSCVYTHNAKYSGHLVKSRRPDWASVAFSALYFLYNGCPMVPIYIYLLTSSSSKWLFTPTAGFNNCTLFAVNRGILNSIHAIKSSGNMTLHDEYTLPHLQEIYQKVSKTDISLQQTCRNGPYICMVSALEKFCCFCSQNKLTVICALRSLVMAR